MEIQKVFLDRILFLVRLGYVTPIFKYMVSHAGELSDSLKVHFVKEVNSNSIFSETSKNRYYHSQ